MHRKTLPKWTAVIMAVSLCLASLTGTAAFYTDKEESVHTAKAGNVEIELTNRTRGYPFSDSTRVASKMRMMDDLEVATSSNAVKSKKRIKTATPSTATMSDAEEIPDLDIFSDYSTLSLWDETDEFDSDSKGAIDTGSDEFVSVSAPEIEMTAIPGSGTAEDPAPVTWFVDDGSYDICYPSLSYWITVKNPYDYELTDVVIQDTLPEELSGPGEITVDGRDYSDDKDYSNLTWSLVDNELTITLVSLPANTSYLIEVECSSYKEQSTVMENTAYVTSVAGHAVNVESNTTYHQIEEITDFIAGSGIDVSWVVQNVGSKSVFEKSVLTVNGIPDGTELYLYNYMISSGDINNCKVYQSPFNPDEEYQEPMAILTAENNSVDLYGWMNRMSAWDGWKPEYPKPNDETKQEDSTMYGTAERDGNDNQIYYYELVLYCKKGSMAGVPFTVDVTSTATQSRNNNFFDKWLGFSDTKTIRLLDVK